MEKSIEKLLEHRTIRQFKHEGLPQEVIELLLHVANSTATSTGMQGASIIRITDQEKKNALADIGRQSYMADAPELWIFIVDLWRNVAIAERYATKENLSFADRFHYVNMDKFFQGYTDACLMAQNVVAAAEILGYGTNYFGNVQNDLRGVIKLLDLPRYTLPVVGLGIGLSNQDPQKKPRLPLSMKVFCDGYQKQIDEEALKDYDAIIQTYYDLREGGRPQESFSKQAYTKQGNTLLGRNDILEVMKEQGFAL